MGILFSRFHKKITTIEILDNLDKRIKDIEQYGQNTEQRHKKIIEFLIIYSVILYIIIAWVFYFYFFPAELYDQLFYITPLLLFPILILFTKNIVSWYYIQKLSRNQEKLTIMLQQKKKILDEVIETETYKKAKEILLKFAPDQLKITPGLCSQTTTISDLPKVNTPQKIISSLQGGIELHRRALTSPNFLKNLSISTVTQPNIKTTPLQTPTIPEQRDETLNILTPSFRVPKSLPRPILSQQRSYIDRLVEYVIGDGPNNRYALICRQCNSHNGMALKEEFEYFAFRCCYCNFWNPARKQKPSAPKLEFDNNSTIPPKLSLEIIRTPENQLKANTNENSDIQVVQKHDTSQKNYEDILTDENDDIEIKEAKFQDEEMEIDELKKKQ